MTRKTSLGPEELRLIGHAINWRLHVPYDHTCPPRLSEKEANSLSRILTDLAGLIATCRSGTRLVGIEVGALYSRTTDRLLLPEADFRLMTEAVASFQAELQGSPTELEVVTGLPPSKTADVLSRLRVILRSAIRQPSRTPASEEKT